MTPEEIEQAVYRLSNQYGMLNSHRVDTIRLIHAAVEAERERCAKVAHAIGSQQVMTSSRSIAFDIEDAIRARGETHE
jgi:hypothetical protein